MNFLPRPIHFSASLKFRSRGTPGWITRAVQRSAGHGMGEHATTQYRLEATYYGPGFQITDMDSVVQTLMYNAHTMVDE